MAKSLIPRVSPAAEVAFQGPIEAIEGYMERGWTDGLPIIPPTPKRVQEFLDYVGIPADEVLGQDSSRAIVVTAQSVAINAVMAGCKPEYFPAVLAAMRNLLEYQSYFHGTTGTVAGAAQVLILNGPIRRELGINCKTGIFGPGFRANATIGRAVRLTIRNVGRAIPGGFDRASFSQGGRYSWCFGENEEDSPWVPLHVERGFPLDSSTVTNNNVMYTMNLGGGGMRSAQGILDNWVRQIRAHGGFTPLSRTIKEPWLENNMCAVIVVGPEQMGKLAGEGWTKKDIREYVFPRVTDKMGDPDYPDSLVGKPANVLLVAAGGPGMASSVLLVPHVTWTFTREVEPRRR